MWAGHHGQRERERNGFHAWDEILLVSVDIVNKNPISNKNAKTRGFFVGIYVKVQIWQKLVGEGGCGGGIISPIPNENTPLVSECRETRGCFCTGGMNLSCPSSDVEKQGGVFPQGVFLSEIGLIPTLKIEAMGALCAS